MSSCGAQALLVLDHDLRALVAARRDGDLNALYGLLKERFATLVL